jgi:TetR/AcrR family transcriptional regulator, tetracycline repressor protein
MSLQRADVARAALRLLDEVGLDRLTMRRLASYLNIQGASLYWHFTNKQELLNCMAEVMVADAFADLRPPEADQDWATWLAGYARLLRRMALGHRDGVRILAVADLFNSPFFAGIDLAVQVLYDAGFGARQALTSVLTILNYVLGDAFYLQADPSRNSLQESERGALLQHHFVDSVHFPALARLVGELDMPFASTDTWFEEGLRLLLDGMRVALSQERH